MKKMVLAIILMGLSVSAQAQQFHLKQDELICTSENAYNEQMQYLSQGVKQFVSGCGATPKEYQIVMLDFNTYSASKGRIVENGRTVWFSQESTKVIR